MFPLSIAYSSNRIRGRRSSDIDVFGVGIGVGIGIGIGIETGSPFSGSIPTPMIPPVSERRHVTHWNGILTMAKHSED